MIQQISQAARRCGILVGMCGEMAGDPRYALVLLALGLNELSMTAGQIPAIKQRIRRLSRAEARTALDEAMRLTTAEEIERFLDQTARRLAPSEAPA